MTGERRDSDDAQPLSCDDEDAEFMCCTGLFSEDRNGEDWITAAFASTGVTPFAPIWKLKF